MSTVDKRVVELELDNSKFNRDVGKTESKLESLKKTLNFDDVSKSLDKVQAKFSTMDVVAMTVISNITTSVMNMGVRLVKSLSIDNISTGWSKFEQKTKSVATIMAQTIKIAGHELDNYTDKMEAVDKQLTKLNWFTDQTSYSFTDMVDNIGKFTAAGQDLDKSVDAMMGIANWAALSGQNAMTASRAMFQLAQAMSKGSVQLIDYKSIQNANMDTQEFRQTVLDTAVALGELQKVGDSYISKKGGGKFTRNQFTESLSSKWFTADVLTESLSKYSSAIDRLYEISEETGLTAAQVMSRYSDEFDEFGLKAFRAAQEARTFTDTINAIKDAVSTGWLNTAEHIFGGYTESKVLWSDLADSLYDVFAAGGDVRNQILKVWSTLDGRGDLFAHDPNNPEKQGAFWNIYDAIVSLVNVVKNSLRQVFTLSEFESTSDYVNDVAVKFKSLTTNLQESTKRFKDFISSSSLFGNSVRTIFGGIKIAISLVKALRFALDPVISTVTNFVRNILSNISRRLSSISWIEGFIEKINIQATKLYSVLDRLMNQVSNSTGINKITTYITALFDSIKNMNLLDKASRIFNDFVSSFIENGGTIENFAKIIKGVFNVIKITIGLVKNLISSIVKTLGPTISTVFGKIFKVLSVVLGKTVELIATFFEELGKFSKQGKEVGVFDSIAEFIDSIKIDKAAVSLADTFASVLSSLKETFSTMLTIMQYMLPVVNALLKIITVIIKDVSESITSILTKASEGGGIKVLIMGLLSILTVLVGMILLVSRTTVKAIKLIDSVRGVFNSLSRALTAGMFTTIAAALVQVAAAFYILGKMDIGALGRAVLSLTFLSVALSGMYIFAIKMSEYTLKNKDKVGNIKNSIKQIQSMAFALVEMSIAMLIVSKAASRFAKMDTESFSNALMGVGVCVGALAAMSILLSKIKIKGAEVFKITALSISLSLSISILAGTLMLISKISWTTLGVGTLKFVSVLTLLFIMFKAIDKFVTKSDKLYRKLLMFDILAINLKIAITAIASTLKALDKLKFEALLLGIVKMGAMLITMVAMIEAIKDINVNASSAGKIIAISFLVTIFSNALKVASLNLKKIGELPFINILKSVLSISAILLAMFAITKINFKSAKIIGLSITISIFSGALLTIAESLKQMNGIQYESILKTLLGVGAILGIIFAMSNIPSIDPLKILGISTSMLVLSLALTKYANGLETLASVPFSSIFKGMLALVTGLSILALTSKIMNPSVGAILKISFAVLVLGGALLIVATALRTLSETFDSTVTTMWDTLTDFLYGFLDFVQTNAVKLVELIENILIVLLQAVINIMPKLRETLTQIIKMVLGVIKDVLPDLLKVVADIITGILKMLKDNIKQWAGDLCDILVDLVDALTSHLPQLIESLGSFLESFIINSLKDLSDRIAPILNAAIDFLLKLIRDLGITIKTRARDFAETFVDFGINLIEGLKIGIVSGIARLLEQIPTIGKPIADGFRNLFGIHSPSTVMAEMGRYLDEGLAKGVADNADSTADDMSGTMSKVLSAVNDTLENEIDDSLVLTPVLDLSNINSGVKNISSIMSGVSSGSISVSGKYAASTAADLRNRNSSSSQAIQNETHNNTDNYYVTFNVETNDPEELARQTDMILQRNRLKANYAKGGY